MKPRVLILRAPGINRDEDAAAAIELAGGRAERVHINRVVEGAARLADYGLLIIPGGFSYGDHLGAGKLLAVDLAHRLGDQLAAFVADGRPVIGICNGFQVLTESHLLPGALLRNRGLRFVGRQVAITPERLDTPFTRLIGERRPLRMPVAHGEGCYFADPSALDALERDGQVLFRYADGSNPNGSLRDIAGVMNAAGNVFSLSSAKP